MKDQVEVLIVGAGPVGLALAVDCAQRGISLAVVDRGGGPSLHSKALVIGSASQEYLSTLGVLEKIRKEGIEPTGMRFLARSREFLRLASGEGVDSPFPRFLILPQSSTERILRDRLSVLGHEVRQELEFIGCEVDGGMLVARLRRPTGEELACRCQYLAGCDGVHSAVRHAVGARWEGRALPETFVICDAELSGPSPLPQEIFFCIARPGPLILLPIRDSLWRVISTRTEGIGTAPPTLEEMQEHLSERGPRGFTLSQPQWLSCFPVSERRVGNFRSGRVVLAGDAAHIHNPVGGHGMNSGLLDAFNLAWKLEMILHHHGHPEILLSSYAQERAEAVDFVLRESECLLRQSSSFNGWLQAACAWLVRGLVRFRPGAQILADSFAGTPPTLFQSSALGEDNTWHEDWRDQGFRPGRPVRNVEILAEEGHPVALLNLLFGTRHLTLLLFSGRRPNYRDAAAIQEIREAVVSSRFPVSTLAVWHGAHTPDESWFADPEGVAHRKFGVDQRAAYLIRPDGICALRTQPANWPATNSFLARLFPTKSSIFEI